MLCYAILRQQKRRRRGVKGSRAETLAVEMEKQRKWILAIATFLKAKEEEERTLKFIWIGHNWLRDTQQKKSTHGPQMCVFRVQYAHNYDVRTVRYVSTSPYRIFGTIFTLFLQ